MSEEEQEAIKVLKNEIEQVKHIDNYEMGYTYIKIKHIEILLNLIDKLQKENDKLKYNQLEADELIKALEEKNEEQEKELLHWKGQYHLLSRKIDCISKDTIRDKIKELENHCFIDDEEDYAIEVLQELLEEGQNGSR